MLGFEQVHPFVSLFYFLSVLIIAMFSVNPIFIVIALLGGISFFLKIEKSLSISRDLGFYLLLIIAVTLTNPLFSHKGVTVLFFFNNNPITLESILYGLNLGLTLTSVIFWFKSFNIIMTEEKLLFLLGKASPKIALTISSALRFIPSLKRQFKRIKESQTATGRFSSDSWINKIKSSVSIYSALVDWAFENAIDTGASMKARGYGLKNKSHYSLFRFKGLDFLLLSLIFMCDTIVILSLVLGGNSFSFYPVLSEIPLDYISLIGDISFLILAFLPFALELWGNILWKYYKSKIGN